MTTEQKKKSNKDRQKCKKNWFLTVWFVLIITIN